MQTRSVGFSLFNSALHKTIKSLPPNPKVVNPVSKPRVPSKLSDEDALELIRAVHEKRINMREAAGAYGVSYSTVQRLMDGGLRGHLIRSVEEGKPVSYFKKTRS